MSGWGGKREGSGRPPGSSNKKTQELRALLDPHKEELVAKAVDMALGGDSTALKMCLDRLIPPVKAQDAATSVHIEGETLAEKASCVLALAESGELSVAEVSTLMQMVSTMARIIDVDDLERRVAALEQRQ